MKISGVAQQCTENNKSTGIPSYTPIKHKSNPPWGVSA